MTEYIDGMDVPEDFISDCTNCEWFLANYGRENCRLFKATIEGIIPDGWHVLNKHGTKILPTSEYYFSQGRSK